MSVATDNITKITITDDDLFARVPMLAQFRHPSLPDFSGQIAKGKVEAEVRFQSMKEEVPSRAVPAQPDAWKRILEFSTLTVIFEGDGTPRAIEQADLYRQRFENAMSTFLYQYDFDESGEIDDNVEESLQRSLEMRLRR